MAGILDILGDLFATDQVGINANRKRRQQAAYDANKGDASNVIDPAFIAKTQRSDGIPALPFSAANPKAEAAAKQAAIDAESEKLDAEELARQKQVYTGASNAKANSPALQNSFMDNQSMLSDFRQSEARRAADESINSPSPLQPQAPVPAPTPDSSGGIGNAIYNAIKPSNVQDRTVGSPVSEIGQRIADYFTQTKNPDDLKQRIAARMAGNNVPVPADPNMLPNDPRHFNRDDKMNAPGAPAPDASQNVPVLTTSPNDGRDVDGIFPSIPAADLAKYGQFPAAPKLGEKPVPYVAPDAPAAPVKSAGLFSNIHFDPSVIGPALAALDPRNTGLAANLLNQVDARRQEQTALTEKKANQESLFQYLKGQMPEADAKALSQNEDLAKTWYAAQVKSANPGPAEYGKTPQYVKLNDGSVISVQVSGDGTGVVNSLTGQKVDPTTVDSWVNPADMAAMKKTTTNTANAQFNLPEVAATVDRVDQRVADILSNPGLPDVVGSVDANTPDFLKSSSSIQLRGWLDQIKGENFLTIRQKLKGQGAITDFESSRAESVNAIERAMNARDPEVLKRAITDFQTFVHKWAGIAEQQAGAETGTAGGVPSDASQQNAPDYKTKYGLD